MPGTDLEERFELREEFFAHRGFEVRITLPASSEALIDEEEFDRDERLPYWAELWPAARALARWILELPSLPDRAVELGCGLGLPSLALASRGVHVLATDYYDDALRFTRTNASANGRLRLRTRYLDWRSPPADLGRFPLVVAADVLYEARNVDIMAGLLPALVEPGGSILLADPGRVHLTTFLDRAAGSGWSVHSAGDVREPSPAGNDIFVTIRRYRLIR